MMRGSLEFQKALYKNSIIPIRILKNLTLYKVNGVISIYCKIIKDHQIFVSTFKNKIKFPYNFCAQHGTSLRNLENFIDSYEICSRDFILKD
jgi:hypothetical protein